MPSFNYKYHDVVVSMLRFRFKVSGEELVTGDNRHHVLKRSVFVDIGQAK